MVQIYFITSADLYQPYLTGMDYSCAIPSLGLERALLPVGGAKPTLVNPSRESMESMQTYLNYLCNVLPESEVLESIAQRCQCVLQCDFSRGTQMSSDPQVKPPGTHRLQRRATHFILWKWISTSFERTIRNPGQIFIQFQICGSLHDAPKLKIAILHECRQACAENCSFLHQQPLSVRNSDVRKSEDLKKHPGQRT